MLRLALLSLSHPKVVMKQVLEANIDRKTLYLLTFLLIVLDRISGLILSFLINHGATAAASGPMLLLQLAAILGGTVMVYHGGRMFGGKGSFDDCFKMVLWLNFVFFVLQFAVSAASLVAPEMVGAVILVIGVLSFVQMTAYVMVVHGFEKTLPVVFGIFALQFAFGILFIILMGILGINSGMEPI
jgi:hypothetical protein